jgi:hypothetical protein
VGADDDVDAAVSQSEKDALLLGWGSKSAEKLNTHRNRSCAREGSVVLLCE